MTTEAKVQLASSEIGTLWMLYEILSGRLIMFDFFKATTIDKEAQNIIASYITEGQNIKNEITKIFNNEKAVIPSGFDERDVIKEAPPLFDDIFHIMFLRQMMKLNLGIDGIFMSVSYKKEVQEVMKLHVDTTNKHYVMTSNYLLGKGVLTRPPYVTMPKQVEFIEDKNYMSGYNIFSGKRVLNTIEVGFLYEALEDNIFTMQLLTGFAQVAKESEVKKYFIAGKELGKKNIAKISDVLLQSDIQPPSTWAGKATDSTNTPFSDKLMMYIISLLSHTELGFTAIGTSFSMRSDLPLMLGLMSKDTFDYAKEGSKLMIKHKWMEEPPQMEDRNQLATIK